MADPLTVANLAASTNLSADAIFLEALTFGSGGHNAVSVAIADVNGDGKPDLLVANQCSTSNCGSNGIVGVLLGNGDGTFQAAVVYASGGVNTSSVAVADVNGDGRPDLLISNQCVDNNCANGSVGVLLGNGDGTFQPAASYGSGGEFAYSIAVADVNGDGKPDLLVANQCATSNCTNPNGTVGVLLGNGNGTFQPVLTYASGGNSASFVAVADVNGDHKPDLLVANQCATGSNCAENAGVVGVLLGNGDGTFQPAVSYASGGQGASSVAVHDVDGDGKPDLLVANYCVSGGCGDGTVAVLLGRGDGTFGPPLSYDSGGAHAFSVAVEDVNGDGKPDLLVINQCVAGCASGAVGVLLGNGDGTFRGAKTYTSAGWGNVSMAVADVNGDGKPDLLVANECPTGNCTNTNGSVSVLLGNGDGTFQPPTTYSSGGFEARSIAVSDVNGDGKLDLLVANSSAINDSTTGTVSVLLGNGDGSFQSAVPYNSGGTDAESMVVADVNGDGKPDVLIAHYYAYGSGPANPIGAVGVLLGNGDGTFQPAVSYGSGGLGAVSIAVADVNRDGKPDVVVANLYGGNYSAATIGVLLGNGDGTFQPATTYPPGGQFAESIAVGDVNGDGVPDLVVSNQCNYGVNNCSNLVVLFGNGNGTFQPAQAIEAPSTDYNSLTLADFNGDGKLDIASASGGFLLLGSGNGIFQPSLLLGSSGPGIAVGDFNLDGKPDLAVGGVTILLNISPTTVRTPIPTTTALASSLQSSTYGQNLTFTATVIPQGGGTPTGAVTFADGATTLASASLKNGTAVLSTTALTAGTHSIVASYNGDSNFASSTSAFLSQTVSTATTTTTLVSSANPSYLNQSVTFTATVKSQYSGALMGHVTFKQGTTALATVSLANGQAAYTSTYTTSGTRFISAVYSGDGNNVSSASAVLNQIVNSLPAATTTKITTSGSPSFINQPVTFTAAITSTYGPTPDGETVTFYDGLTAIGTGATTKGIAIFTTVALTAKPHTIKASYPGDATFKASSGTVSQVVNLYPSVTSVPTSSLNPSTYGQSVTLRTVVTSKAPFSPTGTVTFKNGMTAVGWVAVSANGVATLTKANLPAGTLSIAAVYNGDSETAKSTSALLSQTLNQAVSTTTVKSSLNPSLLGQSVTFTAAAISPTTTPTGSVTFMDGTNTLGIVALSGGKVSYSTSTLSAGSHNIKAVYNGTANISGSTSSVLVQTVN